MKVPFFKTQVARLVPSRFPASFLSLVRDMSGCRRRMPVLKPLKCPIVNDVDGDFVPGLVFRDPFKQVDWAMGQK